MFFHGGTREQTLFLLLATWTYSALASGTTTESTGCSVILVRSGHRRLGFGRIFKGTMDYDSCSQKCLTMNTCNFISFRRQTDQCNFYTTRGTIYADDKYDYYEKRCVQETTIPATTSNTGCAMRLKAARYARRNTGSISRDKRPLDECLQHCMKTASCAFVTHHQNSKWCNLFHSDGDGWSSNSHNYYEKACSGGSTLPVTTSTIAKGCVMEIKTASYGRSNNGNIFNGVRTLAECLDICANMAACLYVSFEKRSNWCVLFQSNGNGWTSADHDYYLKSCNNAYGGTIPATASTIGGTIPATTPTIGQFTTSVRTTMPSTPTDTSTVSPFLDTLASTTTLKSTILNTEFQTTTIPKTTSVAFSTAPSKFSTVLKSTTSLPKTTAPKSTAPGIHSPGKVSKLTSGKVSKLTSGTVSKLTSTTPTVRVTTSSKEALPSEETSLSTAAHNIETNAISTLDFPVPSLGVNCSQPRVIENATVHVEQATDAMFLILTCTEGYAFNDDTTAKTIPCFSNGSWSDVIPQCSPKEIYCPVLPLIHNGTLSSITLRRVGTTVIAACDEGLRMRDGSQTKVLYCASSGVWTDEITDCEENNCLPIPYIGNSIVNSTKTHSGTVVQVTCYEGFRFPDEMISKHITCQDDGSWQPFVDQCYPMPCPKLMADKFTYINSTRNTYGTYVRCACHEGYLLNTNNSEETTVCLSNQRWSVNLTSCSIITCDRYPVIENATWESADLVYGSTVNYTCIGGYRFPDGHVKRSIICTGKGTWNDTQFDCRPDRCHPVPEVLNSVPSTLNTAWWTVVIFTCISGHLFPDGTRQKTLQCLNTASWSGELPPCEPMQCYVLRNISNGRVHYKSITYSSSAEYTCDEGYTFQNNQTSVTVTCSAGQNESVTWSPVIGSCIPVLCPPLPQLTNASLSSNNNTFSARVEVICADGYEIPNLGHNVTTVCTSNGSWDKSIVPCIEFQCPPLPTWSDMIVNTTSRIYNTVARYECAEGYTFNDSDSVKFAVCSGDKTWEPNIKQCSDKNRITDDIRGRTWEAKYSRSIGTVATILSCAVLVFIFSIDLSNILRELCELRNNLLHFYTALKEF